MEGPSARALALRPLEADGRVKRGRQMRRRPHAGAVNKPAAGDAVGATVQAEVAAPNPLITPPTSVLLSVLPADVSSGADELLKPFTFDLENPNADVEWSDADFACLEGDLELDWGLAAGLTGV